ncbi:MAG: MFS transporter [Gemmataceae bacterium]|nr:MFS transporter [Gemmataceae bacterium]
MGQPDSLLLLQRPTRARWLFLTYAAALSLILYLDRICIAESAGAIGAELGLSDVQRGWMFTAFTIGYMLFEIPSGAWGDRYGPRRVLLRIVLCWSLFTALTGCVQHFILDSGHQLDLFGLAVPLLLDGFLVLLLVRFLFGAAEAGAYPNLAKSSSAWFPAQERGLAQGVVATAGRLGGGMASGATILVAGVVNEHLWPGMGWRVTFWVFGSLGVIWAILFARWFRNSPADHPSVNAAELALIRGEHESPRVAPRGSSSHHDTHGAPPVGFKTPWAAMLTSPNLWAYSLSAFCSAFVVYLYFTRFPEYLQDRHGVPKATWGWVAGLPMVCGAVGCVLGGVLTDLLVRRTGSRRWGRRTMGMVGKGGGGVLLLCGALMDQPALALVFIAASAFMADLALAAHWAVCTDAGGRFVGTVFGVMNMVAAVGASLSPVLAGYVLSGLSPRDPAGHFNPAERAWAWDVVLYVYAVTLVVGALCWLRIDAEESMVG